MQFPPPFPLTFVVYYNYGKTAHLQPIYRKMFGWLGWAVKLYSSGVGQLAPGSSSPRVSGKSRDEYRQPY